MNLSRSDVRSVLKSKAYKITDQIVVSLVGVNQVLASMVIPDLAPGAVLEIETQWSMTNSANQKLMKLQLNGQDFMDLPQTTAAGFHGTSTVVIRSLTSQIATNKSTSVPFGTTSSSGPTSLNADLAAGATLSFVGNRANGADALALEFAIVRVSQ